jgi:hypothetical protein
MWCSNPSSIKQDKFSFRAELLHREKLWDANVRLRVLVKPDLSS